MATLPRYWFVDRDNALGAGRVPLSVRGNFLFVSDLVNAIHQKYAPEQVSPIAIELWLNGGGTTLANNRRLDPNDDIDAVPRDYGLAPHLPEARQLQVKVTTVERRVERLLQRGQQHRQSQQPAEEDALVRPAAVLKTPDRAASQQRSEAEIRSANKERVRRMLLTEPSIAAATADSHHKSPSPERPSSADAKPRRKLQPKPAVPSPQRPASAAPSRDKSPATQDQHAHPHRKGLSPVGLTRVVIEVYEVPAGDSAPAPPSSSSSSQQRARSASALRRLREKQQQEPPSAGGSGAATSADKLLGMAKVSATLATPADAESSLEMIREEALAKAVEQRTPALPTGSRFVIDRLVFFDPDFDEVVRLGDHRALVNIEASMIRIQVLVRAEHPPQPETKDRAPNNISKKNDDDELSDLHDSDGTDVPTSEEDDDTRRVVSDRRKKAAAPQHRQPVPSIGNATPCKPQPPLTVADDLPQQQQQSRSSSRMRKSAGPSPVIGQHRACPECATKRQTIEKLTEALKDAKLETAAELDRSMQETRAARTERARTEQELARAKDAAASDRAKCAQLEAEVEHLKREMARKVEAARAEGTIEGQEEATRWREACDVYKSELARVIEEADDRVRGAEVGAEERLAALEDELADANRRRDEVEEELSGIAGLLVEEKRRCSAAESAVDRVHAELRELRARADEAAAEASESQTKADAALRQTRKKAVALKRRVKELEEALDEQISGGPVAELQSLNRKLELELTDVRRDLGKHEDDEAALHDVNAKLRRELDAASAELDAAAVARAEHQADADERADTLKVALKGAKEDLAASRNEIQQLRHELQQAVDARDRETKKRAAVTAEMQRDIENARDELDELRARLASGDASAAHEMTTLKTNANKAAEDRDRVELELAEVQSDFEAAMDRLERAESDLKRVKADLRETKEDLMVQESEADVLAGALTITDEEGERRDAVRNRQELDMADIAARFFGRGRELRTPATSTSSSKKKSMKQSQVTADGEAEVQAKATEQTPQSRHAEGGEPPAPAEDFAEGAVFDIDVVEPSQRVEPADLPDVPPPADARTEPPTPLVMPAPRDSRLLEITDDDDDDDGTSVDGNADPVSQETPTSAGSKRKTKALPPPAQPRDRLTAQHLSADNRANSADPLANVSENGSFSGVASSSSGSSSSSSASSSSSEGDSVDIAGDERGGASESAAIPGCVPSLPKMPSQPSLANPGDNDDADRFSVDSDDEDDPVVPKSARDGAQTPPSLSPATSMVAQPTWDDVVHEARRAALLERRQLELEALRAQIKPPPSARTRPVTPASASPSGNSPRHDVEDESSSTSSSSSSKFEDLEDDLSSEASGADLQQQQQQREGSGSAMQRSQSIVLGRRLPKYVADSIEVEEVSIRRGVQRDEADAFFELEVQWRAVAMVVRTYFKTSRQMQAQESYARCAIVGAERAEWWDLVKAASTRRPLGPSNKAVVVDASLAVVGPEPSVSGSLPRTEYSATLKPDDAGASAAAAAVRRPAPPSESRGGSSGRPVGGVVSDSVKRDVADAVVDAAVRDGVHAFTDSRQNTPRDASAAREL